MAGAAINQSLPAGGRLLHRTQSDEECDIMIGALRIELDGIRVSGMYCIIIATWRCMHCVTIAVETTVLSYNSK